ncbi:MAG: endolytic transglycosylase MltG [Oscillospiraceae bacterium]|nr:endolytic transglycosylase MltG [Oscillospiraceae bacterium]
MNKNDAQSEDELLKSILGSFPDENDDKDDVTPSDSEAPAEKEDIGLIPDDGAAGTADTGEIVTGDTEEPEEDDEEEESVPEPERTVHKKRRKKRRGAGRLVFALIMVTLVITVAVLSAAAVITVSTEILGLQRTSEIIDVEIPENSGTEAIADLLESEGIINNPVIFRVYSRVKGADGTYMAGLHELNPNMTYSDVIEALQKEPINNREFVTITFPEGIRLIDAAKKLEENGVCGADEFIRAFNSTKIGFDFEDQVKPDALKFYKMEGYFFPDTYDFFLDEEPKTVVKKVFKNFDYRVTPDYYGLMKDMDMTLEEVITLASIVQREASDPYDMKYVASVFLNRLHDPENFPKLQSDPTSNYVDEVIRPNLEISSGNICDAYDTYKGNGLPPGPICNPGIDAIEAVLYPRDTDYYYFCSKLDTEEFFYAETLEEHEQNLIEAGLR